MSSAHYKKDREGRAPSVITNSLNLVKENGRTKLHCCKILKQSADRIELSQMTTVSLPKPEADGATSLLDAAYQLINKYI